MELSGNTRFLSLFDVVQVLSVNAASGMLRVTDGKERGYLYFQEGSVINALDSEHHEGEDAAKRVFAIRDAQFSFDSDLPSVAHRITCSPQNLMMEIARQLDEEGGPGAPHLDEAQQATTLLNELFTRIDSESKVLAHTSPQGLALSELLGAIRDTPESVLYLRTGACPEVHVAGRAIPISETPLDAESYQSLRDHLVRESAGMFARLDSAGGSHTLRLSDTESYRVEVLKADRGELLTIRRWGTPAELAGAMPWPAGAVDAVMAGRGTLTLVAAPDPHALERAFGATVAHLLRGGPGALVGIAPQWPPGLGDGDAAAMLLESTHEGHARRARDLVDRIGPAWFVAGDSDTPGSVALALRAARRGARTIVGVCAALPGTAPLRLLDPLDAADRAQAAAEIGAFLSAVLAVGSAPDAPGQVWRPSDAARTALIRGDLATSARELAAAPPASS